MDYHTIRSYAENVELWMALTVHSWVIIGGIGLGLSKYFGRELSLKELLFVGVEIPKALLASAWAGGFVGFPVSGITNLVFHNSAVTHWALVLGWVAGSIGMMIRALSVIRWDLNREKGWPSSNA